MIYKRAYFSAEAESGKWYLPFITALFIVLKFKIPD